MIMSIVLTKCVSLQSMCMYTYTRTILCPYSSEAWCTALSHVLLPALDGTAHMQRIPEWLPSKIYTVNRVHSTLARNSHRRIINMKNKLEHELHLFSHNELKNKKTGLYRKGECTNRPFCFQLKLKPESWYHTTDFSVQLKKKNRKLISYSRFQLSALL